MRHAALVLLFSSLALAGCAKYYWTKTAATDEQFYKDSHECALEASPPRAPGVEKMRMSDDLYNACLSARGYRRDKYAFPPDPHWRGVAE
jgi:hypothetical protein